MNNQAFTLIELLVVVLIIGILASVALPKYQLAVDKSRYVTMISAARSIENAQDAYYMANGQYASDWDELDVSISKDLPTNDEGRLMIGPAGFAIGTSYTSAIYFDTDKNTRIASFTLYHRFGGTSNDGEIRCITYASRKKRGKAICESMGGQLISTAKCGDSGNEVCSQYKLTDF